MSLRQQMKSFSTGKHRKFSNMYLVRFFLPSTAPYYLVFFKKDKTVAPTKASAIIEDAEALKIGSVCHVKEKKKIYEGIVVTFGKIHVNQFLWNFSTAVCSIQSYNYYYYYYYTILGSKDEVDTVEEQYLSEVYTPDFLKGLCDSDESDEMNDEDESEENDNAADDCTTDGRKNATSIVSRKRAKTDGAFELLLTCTLYNNIHVGVKSSKIVKKATEKKTAKKAKTPKKLQGKVQVIKLLLYFSCK